MGGALRKTTLHTALWFIDGSGGENHFRTSLSISFTGSSFSVHKLAKSVVDHEHFISLTSVRITVQRKLDNQSDELRTPISLGYGHLDLLLYEVI